MKKVLLLLVVLGNFALDGQDAGYDNQEAVGNIDRSSWQNASNDRAATMGIWADIDQVWVAIGTHDLTNVRFVKASKPHRSSN